MVCKSVFNLIPCYSSDRSVKTGIEARKRLELERLLRSPRTLDHDLAANILKGCEPTIVEIGYASQSGEAKDLADSLANLLTSQGWQITQRPIPALAMGMPLQSTYL